MRIHKIDDGWDCKHQYDFSMELPRGSKVLNVFENPLREPCFMVLESDEELTENRNFLVRTPPPKAVA